MYVHKFYILMLGSRVDFTVNEACIYKVNGTLGKINECINRLVFTAGQSIIQGSYAKKLSDAIGSVTSSQQASLNKYYTITQIPIC